MKSKISILIGLAILLSAFAVNAQTIRQLKRREVLAPTPTKIIPVITTAPNGNLTYAWSLPADGNYLFEYVGGDGSVVYSATLFETAGGLNMEFYPAYPYIPVIFNLN